MKQDMQAVSDTVMTFLEAYAKGDVDACLSVFAQESPILVLGTNLDEVCQSREDLRAGLLRDFASMSQVRWGDARHLHITPGSSHAGVLLELPLTYVAEGKTEQVMFRYAFSLVKEMGQWKIVTGMASIAAAAGSYVFS